MNASGTLDILNDSGFLLVKRRLTSPLFLRIGESRKLTKIGQYERFGITRDFSEKN